MDLHSFVQEYFAVAKNIVERGEEHKPTFIVEIEESGKREIEVIQTRFTDAVESKEAIFAFMRQRLAETPTATAYIFISEAWLRNVKKGENPFDIAPADHPDRVEILMLDGWNRKGAHVCFMSKIKGDGKKRRVLEPEIITATLQGRAACLFFPEIEFGAKPQ